MANKVILGISAFYHDSAAAIISNGEIIAAAQEDRFTRVKHTAEFPTNAVQYCLREAGYTIDELDAVVFYDKPILKFERLLETYYAFAPKGLRQFLTSIPVWLREKMFLKKLLRDGLSDIQKYDKKKLKLYFPEHHLSHAASAFYPSPFEEAAILTIDGVGEWATASICIGKGNSIKKIKELRFPHSVGLLYSAFTYFLGFRVNSGEYKLMGLAPYGNPHAERTQKYVDLIKEHIVHIKDDGSIWLNQDYFNYATGLKMVDDQKWEKLFGFPKAIPDGDLDQKHCDLAHAIQQVTEEIILLMAKEAVAVTGSSNLCLAGGVALNCVANGKLIKEEFIDNLFIQPAAGDAGGALGGAQIVHYMYFGNERTVDSENDSMKGTYLGPYFSEKEVLQSLKRYKAVYEKVEPFESLAKKTADLLKNGNVVGWFQGRMEWGPRALGNRSILADARNEEMQKKLNLKIKYREGFRPFAPSVLAEDCNDYFEMDVPSPYMLLISDVQKSRRNDLPEGYHDMDLWTKLYFKRSDVPSITHLDFSARVQTVHEETNPRYWKLLKAFKELTGYSVLVNTSFNVRGEPIVCTPADAYKCFMRTEMDYLVVNDYILKKTDQPDWENKEKWMETFKKD
ncbi:carbamoyltransferase family protein [Rhodohalobacter sp. 614A]|uniref:carbamoyltransferase family protein n=1 Tax=Rhodohalobacter sp. 614A TaxID=2908649 RepID=UPI001F23BA95